VAEVLEKDGRVDVLVNNAGIFASDCHFEIDAAEFQRIMDVNCLGVFLGMRSVSPIMREQVLHHLFTDRRSILAGASGANEQRQ
jgi:NAD(P)-dependent dehydrogenase (short-subunit alcohol dehydrogenase family)